MTGVTTLFTQLVLNINFYLFILSRVIEGMFEVSEEFKYFFYAYLFLKTHDEANREMIQEGGRDGGRIYIKTYCSSIRGYLNIREFFPQENKLPMTL